MVLGLLTNWGYSSCSTWYIQGFWQTCEISGQVFGLLASFLSNRLLQVALDGKSSQEYPVNAGFPQGSILGPTLFLLYINNLLDDVICINAIYADDTTLYHKCNLASDLWQQLALASELESEIRDTVDWSRKWLADFNAEKPQLVSFDWSNSTGGIDVKMGGSFLEEKWSFKVACMINLKLVFTD